MASERAWSYHPDPGIDAALVAEANESEAFDLSVGYPPRKWECPDCHQQHSRGHVGAIGAHRCLCCGYLGSGGRMLLAGEHDGE